MTSNKNQSTALMLCVFGGYLGAHQFYVGNIGKGLLYMFTCGLFCIGWIKDILQILAGNFCDNVGLPLRGNSTSQYNYNYQGQNYNYDYLRPTTAPAATIPKDYDSMDGHQFEYFCADILRKNGYTDVEVTQGSGDHGIDILATKDDITYAIQCKCYSSNIGNAAVQQAHTGKSLYNKDIAVVLTNQYFTAQAKQEASALGVKLWDRDKLNKMIPKQD